MAKPVVPHRQRIASSPRVSHPVRPVASVASASRSPSIPEGVPERVPETAGGAGPQQALLTELRARIGAILERPAGPRPLPPVPGAERPGSACSFSSSVSGEAPAPPTAPSGSRLDLGLPEVDAALPWGGLLPAGVHEIKPESAADRPAALAFATALIGRRHRSLPWPVLWGLATREGREHGRPYGPGLARLGLPPESLLLVEARKPADLLWVIEEGLASRRLAGVIALLERVEATPARRLILAAEAAATPCLLLTGARAPGSGVAHTRWRIGSAASAPHPLLPEAPGSPRWRLALERCRQGPAGLAWIVEWCDVSYRFRLASALADRAAATLAAGAGAR